MRNLIRSIAFALGLLPVLAAAQVPQFPQNVPANTVIGRLGIGAGPSQAIPFSTLLSNITSAQAPNTVNAGPTSGGATLPAFRLLVFGDLPQGVARSVIGVTGNATANVANIQGTANQFLGVNSAGTALAFNTMSQDCTLATGVITCTKTNNVAFTAGATAAAGQLPGEPSTGSATSGNVGEYIESIVTVGSPISLVSATAKTITSISLSAGDWDVDCSLAFATGATTSVTQVAASISLVTNTTDLTAGRFSALVSQAFVPGASNAAWGLNVPPLRFSVSGTTSVFLIGLSSFTVSTMTAYGIIRARRVR